MTLRRRLGRALGGPDVAGPAERTGRGAARGGRRLLRARPPDTRGQGPLIGSGGFGVVAVGIVKDEAPYLEEWLCYHLALGVDHFLLYDNGSSDASAGLLERYVNHGLVTLVAWPLRGGQRAAYNHALRFFGPLAAWLAFFDVDEYIVPLVDGDIPSLLARFPDAADVRLPRREFGFSGHRRRPEGLTIEAYTQVADVLGRDLDVPARVKTVLQPRSIAAVDVHLAIVADRPVLVTPDGTSVAVPSATAEQEVHGLAQVNHYYTRSFEEFEDKRFRGSATGRIARPAVPFDLPTIAEDTSAHRFIERTRAMLAQMHSLEPQPYMYGSQLRLERFPRPNDLGRFAEFAIGNLAAGRIEPGRSAALRLRNLYAGIGLVGDLAAVGYRPEPGALSRSAHLVTLIEHMHGRREVDLEEAGDAHRARALRGRFERGPDGSWWLRHDSGRAALAIDLPAGVTRRCHALGFVVSLDGPAVLDVTLEGEAAPAAVRVALPGSSTYAGIVELTSRPSFAGRIRLVLADGLDARFGDLLVVSYG